MLAGIPGGSIAFLLLQFTDHNVLRRKVLHISLGEPLKNDCKPLFIDFQCLVMTTIFSIPAFVDLCATARQERKIKNNKGAIPFCQYRNLDVDL